MECRVGRAGVAEVDGLEPLWVAMVEHHRAVAGATWPVRDAGAAWSIRRLQYLQWLEDGSGTLFVATTASGAAPLRVGYAMLRVEPPGATWDLGAEVGEVESLAVAERARGTGVGTALLAACREELRSRHITHWLVAVVEANADAVRLYEREGFRPYYRLMLGRVDESSV